MPVALAAVPAAVGIAQAVGGWIRQRKADKALQNQKTPIYQPNKAIGDYYQTALNRYNTAGTNTAFYQNNETNARRNLSQGLYGLSVRKGAGIGGIGGLVQGYNDQLAKGAAGAENLKNTEFTQLGGAGRVQAEEDRQAFNINHMLPYQNERDLEIAKLSGGNQILNAGLSNIGESANNAAEIAYAEKADKNGTGGGISGFGRRRRARTIDPQMYS